MSTFKTSYSTVTILGMLNQFHSLANMVYAADTTLTYFKFPQRLKLH